MKTDTLKLLGSLCLGVVLIALCYSHVDRAVALWTYRHDDARYHALLWFTEIPVGILALTGLYYLVFAIRFLFRKALGFHDQALLQIANSVVIAVFLKDQLKIVFGRYWPNTWTHHNPSLLHDHAYGFHFFHAGDAYRSFPSGHTTIVTAMAVAVWFLYPRLRWLCVLAVGLVAVGLIGMDYHFVSDVIAGGLLGATTAIFVHRWHEQNGQLS